ncbi:uncharacterized protein HD556DRAFT_361193 [Suillus plorans]|uniref:Uncharacterized protein n=1 Tax=Suillus plorans TaxID=116603 RepID=A0A9P7AT50_9AGAM|nr:uncharacterized protein HD556DRAFT_361193 [Suillus plorans]KAG1796061.1 hypothetical protein HD556DRAFT_361193 [Suillus plorans]
MEISNDSLFAIESVKLAHQRADLRAILRDEVKAATGRISVSVCGSQSTTRSVRGVLRFPVSSPLSVANGGPSVTTHRVVWLRLKEGLDRNELQMLIDIYEMTVCPCTSSDSCGSRTRDV